MPGFEPGIQTTINGVWMAGLEAEQGAQMMLNRNCHKAAIAARPVRGEPLAYAAIAALACAVVIASLFAAPGRPGFFGAALGVLMLAIAVIDARSFRIPDRLTIAAIALGLANAASEGYGSGLESIAIATMRGILLALAFYGLRTIYHWLRHRQGIGLGDVKLAAVAGAWLDFALIPAAIEIAALTALAGYITSRIVLRRPLSAAAKLPFGLFFAPAIWLCWLLGATT
jgi:leader peptidase (prepilin peptidase) / N-methyltransferase